MALVRTGEVGVREDDRLFVRKVVDDRLRRVVRYGEGFVHRDGLFRRPQNGFLVGIQRHEAEAAAVILGGIPAELAKVCGADDIAFRHGGGRAGAIAVGITLQGSARAGVTLGGDLLDADEGRGLVGRVAGKQFLTQRQRLVVCHGQWFACTGVVRHGGGFVDVDGLRLDAVIGLTLAVQRHKAEAAAVVVGAVPDQTAEICGGNLLVLGNRGQRSVVGAQMQRGRSGTGALGLNAFNTYVGRGMFGILAGERAGAQLHRLVVTGRTGHGGVVIAGCDGMWCGCRSRFGSRLWGGSRRRFRRRGRLWRRLWFGFRRGLRSRSRLGCRDRRRNGRRLRCGCRRRVRRWGGLWRRLGRGFRRRLRSRGRFGCRDRRRNRRRLRRGCR